MLYFMGENSFNQQSTTHEFTTSTSRLMASQSRVKHAMLRVVVVSLDSGCGEAFSHILFIQMHSYSTPSTWKGQGGMNQMCIKSVKTWNSPEADAAALKP